MSDSVNRGLFVKHFGESCLNFHPDPGEVLKIIFFKNILNRFFRMLTFKML